MQPLRSLLCTAPWLALAVPALADPAAEAPPAAVKDGVSLQDIRTFTAVYHLVKQAYVEDKSDAELMQAAIKGLLSGLDPHSEYLDQRELTALTEDTSGAYEGLGIEVFSADGVLRVIAPIDDTPAERAGIKPGDIITRIDGKTITMFGAMDEPGLKEIGKTVKWVNRFVDNDTMFFEAWEVQYGDPFKAFEVEYRRVK